MRNKIIAYALTSSIIFLPSIVLAQSVSGLVQCGGVGQAECGFSDLFRMVENIIKFVTFYLIAPLVTVLVLYYGVRILVLPNKPGELQALKNSLWKVLVGLFFIFTAWFIINMIIRIFDIRVSSDPSQGPVQLLNTN